MSSAFFVYVTAGSVAEAERIGRALVEERLAACANILPGMRSIYRWEGKVEEASEAVLVLKTARTTLAALTARVTALHSYELPCVVALPIEAGNADYLAWIERESQG
jgi:periplasmic divalent cation tolerance protein